MENRWYYRRKDTFLPWSETRVLVASDVFVGRVAIASYLFTGDSNKIAWRTQSGVFIADELIDAWHPLPELERKRDD